MGKPTKSLYRAVVNVTHTYLGPAAERFVSRQIINHLHKDPESLTCEDLIQLLDWIRVAVSLLTDDEKIIEQYTAKLRELAEGDSVKKEVNR